MNNKFLLLTNLVFLGAAIFFGLRFYQNKVELANCKKYASATDTLKPRIPKDTTLGKTQPVAVCTSCEEETIGEDSDHFKRVLENYRVKVWDLINATRMDQSTNNPFFTSTAGIGKNDARDIYKNTDARSIWFSLETIKQFICTIEKNNARLSHPATDLGIRFYYAVYEDTFHLAAKKNQHTLFMVPTYKNGNGSEVDFDPRDTYIRQVVSPSEYKGAFLNKMVTVPELLSSNFIARRMLILSEAQPSPNMPSTYLVQQSGGVGGATFSKNNGELCPTNCPNPSTLKEIDQ